MTKDGHARYVDAWYPTFGRGPDDELSAANVDGLRSRGVAFGKRDVRSGVYYCRAVIQTAIDALSIGDVADYHVDSPHVADGGYPRELRGSRTKRRTS